MNIKLILNSELSHQLYVANELGIDKFSSLWEKAHRALCKYKKSGGYIKSYVDLIEFIKKF